MMIKSHQELVKVDFDNFDFLFVSSIWYSDDTQYGKVWESMISVIELWEILNVNFKIF